MAVEPGSLSNVRDSLSNALEGVLDDNQRQQLRDAFERTGIKDEYESAGESMDEASILESAAEQGDLGSVYSRVYDQYPTLRGDLEQAASNAFSESDKEDIAELANTTNLSEAYSECSRGNADAAAEAIGVSPSDFNPDSANECRNMVATMTNYAESLFNAFRDADSGATYNAPEA
jgi:hypothetical protein